MSSPILPLLVLVLLASAGAFATWIAPRLRAGRETAPPESDFSVLEENGKVVCVRPEGKVESFRWDELVRIEILTTADGPFAPDFFWVFFAEEGGAVIPSGAAGLDPVTDRAFALPGFDHQGFIEGAIPSTEEAGFVVWRRPDPRGEKARI